MKSESESGLVARVLSGDKAAFGDLIGRYQHTAKRVALGMVANEEVARDLVQEAMLRAYLSLRQLRDAERFGAWLYGIILNVCRSYVRDQRADFLSLEALVGGVYHETALPVASDPQEVAEARELHRLVLQAVNALSAKNRAATLLFYYDQFSLREIADILGISDVAVRGRLHKARRELRQQLARVYPDLHEPARIEPRRRKMVRVSIVDVVKHTPSGEEGEAKPPQHVVFLQDEAGERVLPIWVGPWEGQAIAMGLRDFQLPRPVTYEFTANLLQAAGAELEQVRIEALREETFYAVAKLRTGDDVREVDARPSDAMALALRLGTPIFVAEEVFERAGRPVGQEGGEEPQLGNGADRILEEIQQQIAALKPKPVGTT